MSLVQVGLHLAVSAPRPHPEVLQPLDQGYGNPGVAFGLLRCHWPSRGGVLAGSWGVDFHHPAGSPLCLGTCAISQHRVIIIAIGPIRWLRIGGVLVRMCELVIRGVTRRRSTDYERENEDRVGECDNGTSHRAWASVVTAGCFERSE